ncbi:MAG: hypothetical protein VZQ83_08655, partial [Eubacterium sp.]|nr:hypothetical protein [Eubacterium sp.]
MRRNGRKKAIAGLMALTLLLSTVFFALFKYDVFGAVNNSSAVSPNPYVKDGASESTTVGLRGSSTQGTITLTDEGSNVQGKNPAGKYEPWKPYDVLVTYKDGIISA